MSDTHADPDSALRAVLRQLESDSAVAKTLPPPPARVAPVRPRRMRIRTAALLLMAGFAIGLGVVAYLNALPAIETTGTHSTAPGADRIARLEEALAEAEAAQRDLRAQLEATRNQTSAPRRTTAWHEDPNVLNYRSPWRSPTPR